MKIDLKINGKSVGSKNIADVLKDEFKKTTERAMAQKVAEIKCPEHPDYFPDVTITETPGGKSEFNFAACCPAQKQRIIEAFKSK